MASPRRSSARLQGRHAQPQSPSHLSALVERDETPDRGIPLNLNSMVASAPAKSKYRPSKGRGNTTPSTKLQPSSEEMHPSQHQSIAKKREAAANLRPDRNTTSIPIASPTANPFSSPTFEFRFHRPSSELSSEAQKLMDEVREQAAKIKSNLTMERDGDTANANERLLANPKGKIGRYSDVHMQHFKKMTSIANHPSSFRADSSKLASPATKSLKRSNSKAALDRDDARPCARSSPIKPAPLNISSDVPSSPSKRVRTARTTTDSPSTITTPTKASLARSASAKSLKTARSKIPALGLLSTKSLATPPAVKATLPHTDGKLLGGFSSKLNGVRSILRRPQLKFSDDPAKIAAGTHVATPQKSLMEVAEVVEKTPGSPSHRKEKHVNFSSSPVAVITSPAAPTPSPSKQRIAYPSLPNTEQAGSSTPTRNKVHFQSGAGRTWVSGPVDFTFRAGNAISFSPGKVASPTIRQVPPSNGVVEKAAFEFPSVPHGLSNKKRKRESAGAEEVSEDKENVAQVSAGPSKKIKTGLEPRAYSTVASKGAAAAAAAAAGKGRAPAKTKGKGGGKGVLSMSRLNALARPKNRG